MAPSKSSSASAPAAVPTSAESTGVPAGGALLVDTMLASALAGMAARVPLHPLDTLKAKLQVQQHFRAGMLGISDAKIAAVAGGQAAPTATTAAATGVSPSPRSLLALARHTVRVEGLRGLYSGFGVTFFGSAPAACIYFTTYETSKRYLQAHPALSGGGGGSTFLSHFASGLIAEAAACVLWVPVDVVKERLQVQQQLKEMMAASHARSAADASARAAAAAASAPLPSSLGPLLPAAAPVPPASLYRGNIDAIVTIARTEGLRGVYRGYGATLASFGPFSAIYFSGYEQLKALLMRQMHSEHMRSVQAARTSGAAAPADPELGFLSYAFCGGLAGSVATVITNPLDLVKLRMQVQRGNSGLQFGYRHLLHGLRTLVAQEGAQALFKGAGVRCLFHIPSTAITIAIVDTLRQHVTRIRQGLQQRY